MKFKTYKSKIFYLIPLCAVIVACGGSGGGSGSGSSNPDPVNNPGSVSISGEMFDGATLTASVTDDDGVNSSAISYAWSADASIVSGETGSTLVLTDAMVGAEISVVASYTDNAGFSESVEETTDERVASTLSLNATFVKGVVSGGTCELVSIANDGTIGAEVIASATTNDSGIASFSNVRYEGALLVTCRNGSYIDEATGQSRIAPELRAVIDSGITTVVISPFTEIAVQKAEAQADAAIGILTAITLYNTDNQRGFDVTNVVPANLQITSASDNDAGHYATLLAILSQLAANGDADTPAELEALIEDYSNGLIVDDDISTAADDLADSNSMAAGNISDSLLDAVVEDLDLDVDTSGPVDGGGNFDRGTLGDNDSVPEISCDTVLTSTSALEDTVSRTMTAGTTICLADGQYSDLELDFGGAGTEGAPITVAAENPGEVEIAGEVSVRMSGEYVVLQGLIFRDGESASSDFLQTRNGSGVFCNYCRITEIAIIDLDDTDANSGKWLNIYGQHNRIDHSWFSGKTNTGALLIINREIDDNESPEDAGINYTQIDHNYFGNRAPADGKAYAEGSDNDYEAIRLGTSAAHAADSFSVVEYNYFERIDGEAEVISNKSGNNRISNNTIRDSYGSLTTRHGSSATIANNFIIGDGHPFAGGIRIIDDGHRVVNNYVEGARYLNTRFHGGIVIHNSDGSTSNGYQDVSNVLIANNTVVNSVNSLNVNGGNRSDNPEEIFFVNNIIADAVGPIIVYADEGMPANSVYAGNYVGGSEFSDEDNLNSFNGFTQIDPQLEADNLGIYRPVSNSGVDLSADVTASIGGFDPVSDDMDGQFRTTATTSGADEDLTGAITTGVITAQDVGPINYRPPVTSGAIVRVPIENFGFDNGEDGWDFTSPAAVTTEEDDLFALGASAGISGLTGRISQTVNVEPDTNYALTAFTKGPIKLGFTINDIDFAGEFDHSDYRFSQFEFNSENQTSVTLFAELDSAVESNVEIEETDFTDFNSSASGDNPWVIVEGNNSIGQVQRSSNSASGSDGSARFRYNNINETGSPMISQFLDDIQPNTDYELSVFVRADDGVTATMGLYEGSSTNVLVEKLVEYDVLVANDTEQGDDSFREDRLSFNSGSNTSLTLFFVYTPNTIIADGGDPEGEETDFRFDDIQITYEGAPDDDAIGFIDELRLVSYPGL